MKLPGDKSLAHRALLLASLARTPSRIADLPDGDDVARTLACVVALGARVPARGRAVTVEPAAKWVAPGGPLDCGNSGTLARLLLGALAGEGVAADVVGDASLSRRPMRRVAEPLAALFGAPVVALAEGGTLPARVLPRAPAARARIDVDTGAPSAHVKSALLLAARRFAGVVCVRERVPTRDHTERMLAWLCGPRAARATGAGPTPTEAVLEVPLAWEGFDVALPGDVSSAALLAAHAVIVGAPFGAEDVVVNPRRTGFFRALQRMGARVELRVDEERMGEPCGAVVVRPSGALAPVVVEAAGVPDLVDEIPALVAVALCASGTSALRGVGELRHKESDRLARLVELARAFGGGASVQDDTLVIEGGRPRPRSRVHVRTDGDHRLAMAAHALGHACGADVVLDVPGCERTSFPGFLAALDAPARER